MPKARKPRQLRRVKGKIELKFRPPNPNANLVKAIAESSQKLHTLKQEHEVVRQIIRGMSYMDIGREMGISPTEAFGIAKVAITKYITDLQINAPEAKALDLQRLDALLVILWKRAEPVEVIDGKTGEKVMIPGDLGAARLILDVIRLRADIYGYEAAKKMEVAKQVEHLHRLYIGASPDAL